MNDRQHNDQKKNYKRESNDLQTTTQKTKDRATRTQVHRKCKQLLLHYWRPSCYSSYKPDDESWTVSAYDKWNMSVVTYDTYIP